MDGAHRGPPAAVGDDAQLIFAPEPPVGPIATERIWVRVIAREGEILRGRVSNRPVGITGLSVGDEVLFAPAHIHLVRRADRDGPAPYG